MSWLNTPLDQLAWWQLVIIALAWLAVAAVIYFSLLGLDALWRRRRRK